MKITRDKNKKILILFKPEYVDKILKIFDMEECEPEDIPKVTSQADEMRLGSENEKSLIAPYRIAVGSLLSVVT